MIDKIKKFLDDNNLLNDTAKIVVGFSGGFDSSVLLYILSKLKQQFNFSLAAAHLNHGWRKEADAEEEYCRNFCLQNDIEFYTEKLDSKTPKTETAAREARYKFFERACKYFETENIITAHTKSDNVETVLYRIAKGTGIKGLCSIESVTKMNGLNVFRPMMNISRAEIEAFCKENNLTPNNDKSNFDTKYKRNLLRHKILPVLKQINPQAENAINSLSELAKADEEIINEYLETVYKTIRSGKNKFDTKNFSALSKALKQRIIYNFIVETNLEYDKKRVEEILEFIETNSNSKSGRKLSLGKDLWLFCNKDCFYTVSKENISKLSVKLGDLTKKYEFDNYIFSVTTIDEIPKAFPKETDLSAVVNFLCQTGLELRYRREGDKIKPFGMKETIKLKKYFINKGIPNHQKDKIVLLCNGEEVLWAVGIGLSEKLRAQTGKDLYKIKIEEI